MGSGGKPFGRGLHRDTHRPPSLEPHLGLALLQQPCRSDPGTGHGLTIWLAPNARTPGFAQLRLRLKHFPVAAVAWRAEGRRQLCLLLQAGEGKQGSGGKYAGEAAARMD